MTHLIWAAVAIYALERVLRWLDARRADSAPPAADTPVEVPLDLVALALQERELWAQEEMLRAMREKYESLKDWNLVRTALGVAHTPAGDV
jgi:hypothetical protein